MGQTESQDQNRMDGPTSSSPNLTENQSIALQNSDEFVHKIINDNQFWQNRGKDIICDFQSKMIIDPPIRKLIEQLRADINSKDLDKIARENENSARKYSSIIENIKTYKPYSILFEIDAQLEQLRAENDKEYQEVEKLKDENKRLHDEYEKLVKQCTSDFDIFI
ncbi:hypothetical protein TVAG_467270 [Trichomonas vaginalis G3]|uniref:Uncharacterized protein n=1 Tax=Trichomonas vaginalis (strain ATCC PRA-98 / G3) TaxID=412133 RepID=A2FQD3_TRIV3|nr:hypothetical protein TVAGG3_1048080 [Trichomonas vaginalis G3]EAX92880.1 hypothetical protein TVAG_467270 [Trichomonas vaginalis G3]KAI5494019.1 hypothetical protein TVAGG3_1048080 [Trichomonas vaginalis G3]|eukprot:XP_001305810.1 hypothetical protein [Trichomonas vaginalis G3]